VFYGNIYTNILISLYINKKRYLIEMINNINKEFLEHLLKKCGQIALAGQSRLNVLKKENTSGFTTDLDQKIGSYIYKQISTKYPSDSIECEDVPQKKNGTNNRVWYVDPLDGTTNYIHKLPFFAISISCYDKQKSLFLASGVYIPYFKQLFTAYGSQTSNLNGKKIKVSSFKKLKESLVLTGMSFKVKKNDKEIKTFQKISSTCIGTRRSGSAAFDLCYVAAGFADAYYHFNLKPWDVAAGAHLVINAGGVVSNIGSLSKLNFSKGTILATNKLVYKELNKELIKGLKEK